MIITGPQCRAARVLVEWPIEEVARRSGVAASVITAFEARAGEPSKDDLRRIVTALEDGGAIFIPESGSDGCGVRLKFSNKDARAINRWESEGGPPGSDDVLA